MTTSIIGYRLILQNSIARIQSSFSITSPINMQNTVIFSINFLTTRYSKVKYLVSMIYYFNDCILYYCIHNTIEISIRSNFSICVFFVFNHIRYCRIMILSHSIKVGMLNSMQYRKIQWKFCSDTVDDSILMLAVNSIMN